MANLTIFGKGNMGLAIGNILTEGGHDVTYIRSADAKQALGDVVIFAVGYPAIASIIEKYKAELAGKIIVDITNPLDFSTMDSLVVPVGSSAAEIIAAQLPDAKVIKAFNTNFAATLVTKKVAGAAPTVVLYAGDDEAKAIFAGLFADSGLELIDAGSLKRAQQLEALGFLQLTLAMQGKINWTGGFTLLK